MSTPTRFHFHASFLRKITAPNNARCNAFNRPPPSAQREVILKMCKRIKNETRRCRGETSETIQDVTHLARRREDRPRCCGEEPPGLSPGRKTRESPTPRRRGDGAAGRPEPARPASARQLSLETHELWILDPLVCVFFPVLDSGFLKNRYRGQPDGPVGARRTQAGPLRSRTNPETYINKYSSA